MKIFIVFANLIILLFLGVHFNRLPPQIPLFYSKPWGEDQLADTWMIFLLPILMNFFLFLNNFIYKKLFFANIFVKKIIEYLNFFLIITVPLIFIRIITLIT